MGNDRYAFLLSLVAAFAVVGTLSPAAIMSTFIVMGQGHFLLAYLYQWRAGKIGWRYGALYAAAFTLLLIAYQYIPEPKLWTFFVAGSIFAIHFFVDEYFLAKITLTLERILLGSTFIGLYSMLLLRALYFVTIPGVLVVIAGILLIPLIVQIVRTRVLPFTDGIFILGSFVLLLLLVQPHVISLHAALGFIIFAHYFRWYLHFYMRLKASPDQARFKKYLVDVAVVNALVVILFGIFVMYPGSILQFAFAPTFFFMWTILHVLFSIRVPASILAYIGIRF